MRKVQFKYALLDKNEVFKKWLKCVEDADISYSSLGRLKQSLDLKIREDASIDYQDDRIAPYCIIDNVEYPLGIFLINSPNRNIESTRVVRQITCYSKLKILDDASSLETYYVPKGTNVVNEIKRIFALLNLTCNIPDSDLTTSTDRTWDDTSKYLDIINDLLDVVNYHSLCVANDGTFYAKKYVEPQNREVEITYKEGEGSIISKERTESYDYYDIPNVIVLHTNDESINPPLRAVYPLQTDDNITVTIDGRRPKVYKEEVTDIADLETLMLKAKKRLYELRTKYTNVEITTAINPIHNYLNCLAITLDGNTDKYIETSWSFGCRAGEQMKHSIRKAVTI